MTRYRGYKARRSSGGNSLFGLFKGTVMRMVVVIVLGLLASLAFFLFVVWFIFR